MKPVQPLSPEEVAALNPGIRYTVQKLREWGFETCDSGDGVTHECECDKPYPYVCMTCLPALMASSADALMRLLKFEHGIDFLNPPDPQEDVEGWSKYPSIEATYSPADGHAVIVLMNVILTEP